LTPPFYKQIMNLGTSGGHAMVHRTRGQGEVVPNSAVVLKAMGECRKAILHVQRGVRPFGVAWHALAMVPAAIDAAALS
jgi:hypothetical protein